MVSRGADADQPISARQWSAGFLPSKFQGVQFQSKGSAVHYVGTIASAALLIWAIASQNWWWLLGGPVFGYGPAWFGHFFIEKNRPATFEAPLWSLMSDYRMCGLFLSGRLGDELMKHQIRD